MCNKTRIYLSLDEEEFRETMKEQTRIQEEYLNGHMQKEERRLG